jgi:hypothetical protein
MSEIIFSLISEVSLDSATNTLIKINCPFGKVITPTSLVAAAIPLFIPKSLFYEQQLYSLVIVLLIGYFLLLFLS